MRLGWIDLGKPILVIILQQECSDMAPDDLPIVEGELGVNYSPADHPVRFSKVVLVMTVSAAECHDRCHRVSAAAGPAGALLVVGSPWGHIAQRDPRQS